MKILSVIIMLVIRLEFTLEANILGIFPSPSKSHQIVYRTLMEELTRRGHDVAVMTTDPDDVSYKQLDVHDVSYEIYDDYFQHSDIHFPNNDLPYKAIESACKLMLKIIDKQFSTPVMQDLIHNYKNNSYDLIFVEGVFPIAHIFKRVFNCPIILISSLSLSPNIFDEFGNPLHPVIFPDMFATIDPVQSTIWDRFSLLFRHLGFKIYYYGYYAPLFDSLMRKHFAEPSSVLDVGDRNADMVFINHNPVWNGVRPLVPAIIPIGSLHTKQIKPLSKELRHLLDDASNGVIYFSFGTNVNPVQFSSTLKETFVETFKSLPYTVMWKWDTDNMTTSSNIYTSKWFPQLAILNHTNVKLFITQGGQQSVEEAIHCAVPMLVLPLLFDQEANAHRVQTRGLGKSLSIHTLTKESFRSNILEVIKNYEYKRNIRQFRELLEDDPQSSLERAVWWTEYVIRHKGAKHLSSPAVNSSTISYFLIDLLLVSALVSFITIVIVSRIFRWLMFGLSLVNLAKRYYNASPYFNNFVISMILALSFVYFIIPSSVKV